MNPAYTSEHSEAASQLDAATHAVKVLGPDEGQACACPPLRLVSLLTPHMVEVRRPEVIVGRHSNSDLQLMQPDISRHHCRIFFAGDQWQIGDLGSLNGIQVNNEKVQSAVLRKNDVVGIATHLFRVVLDCENEAEPSVPEEGDRARQVLQNIAEAFPDQAPNVASTRKRSA